MKENITYRMIHITPKPGVAIVDPATGKNIPAEGALVPNDKYFRRRLKDGDAVETPAAAPATPSKKNSKEG